MGRQYRQRQIGGSHPSKAEANTYQAGTELADFLSPPHTRGELIKATARRGPGKERKSVGTPLAGGKQTK